MNYPRTIVSAGFAAGIAFLGFAALAQEPSNSPYMNPKLPAEERAADLVEAIDDLLEFLVPNQEQVKIQVLRSSGYGVWIHVTRVTWVDDNIHQVLVCGLTQD